MNRKRYVIVGTGGRAVMYVNAIMGEYKQQAELMALCDTNQTRMDYYNRQIQDKYKATAVPTYKADNFNRMIAETRPDIVIVVSIDCTHHDYICRAMELGCDCITEKPMTIDAKKCQQIIDTIRKTGKNLVVTFNYRYSPRSSRIKEVIQDGMVGDILSIHFEWLLDTSHGADYFRRWHRDKKNSGGLLVHKSTHHFDLINWVIDSTPETVFAIGDLRFYGRANAESRGITEFYTRTRGSKVAETDPFALKITEDKKVLMALYYNAEHEDGYFRDQSVFAEGITIEDTIGVLVRYKNYTLMTYSLNAHCPWEGYRMMFNGTKGRLEVNVVETPFVDVGKEDFSVPGMRDLQYEDEQQVPEITFQPHWHKAKEVEYEKPRKGGHGGGDTRLLKDIFLGAVDDPLGRAAGYIDGVRSVLVGIAANESMRTGRPVNVDELVKL